MPPKLTTMIQGLFVGHWLMHDLLVLPLDVHRSSLPLLKMVMTLRYHLRTSIFISRTWKWNVLIVIWNKTNIILIHVTTWGALTLYITDIGWCYRWKGHPNYKIKGPYLLNILYATDSFAITNKTWSYPIQIVSLNLHPCLLKIQSVDCNVWKWNIKCVILYTSCIFMLNFWTNKKQ